MPPINLRRRLTLPKYLFRQAQRTLQRPEPYSWGLATSLLQDAVESFLRVLAEHRRLQVGDSLRFPAMLGKAEQDLPIIGGYHAFLTKLNATRVAFKHRGQEVSKSDAQVFVANVESFLTDVCKETLGIDFSTLSLADAIGHQRTQNWLRRAETSLADNQYREAVAFAAGAMRIYIEFDHEHDSAPQLREMPNSIDLEDETFDIRPIARNIRWIAVRFDLLARGVDARAFDRFTMLAPRTDLLSDGTVRHIWYRRNQGADLSWEDARFCIDYVVETALALRESRFPKPSSTARNAEECVVVRKPCEVLATLKTEPPEVIQSAAVGDQFFVAPKRKSFFANSEYLAVIQDGDVAYIRRDCLDRSDPN